MRKYVPFRLIFVQNYAIIKSHMGMRVTNSGGDGYEDKSN